MVPMETAEAESSARDGMSVMVDGRSPFVEIH
jgi:hypothetical protein